MSEGFFVKKSTPEEEACYRELVAVIQKWTATSPAIKNVHVMAMLGRAAGYCIAMCLPAERNEARRIVDKNIVEGIRAVRQI